MRNWFRSGTPWIWLNAGALALSLVMVVGLLSLIAVRGFSHFWPADIVQLTVVEDGQQSVAMGELVRSQTLASSVITDSGVVLESDDPLITRHLLKVGNRDVYGRDFRWFLEPNVVKREYPANAIGLERREWGNFYGIPVRLLEGDTEIASGDAVLAELPARIKRVNQLYADIRSIERGEIGDINHRLQRIRLNERRLELNENTTDAEMQRFQQQAEIERETLEQEFLVLRGELDQLYASAKRDQLVMKTADGQEVTINMGDVVHAWAPNAMNVFQKLGHYFPELWNFLTGEPREANTEGGIFPAIFGTVTMVLLMSIIVTPFGVLAAIYLREYAKQGPLLKIIRVSVYNLAGVPSIVFGVFGLGFFVYTMGGSIDQIFYPESLPAPTFGSPGLFWASLTLALLTLPVVIVSTEEGLARIPSTIRQGSLALGATKSETLWKVVVPLAAPAMMTGLILAIARAAGEVAPLMLVGVVKLAPSLPIDGNFPFIHLDRQIMHLGFHIYDVGFQSPNVEAARPLVYATALTLVGLIIILNMTAISIRNRLREKYRSDSD
ncbi:MAG: phosphate ABC transporter permease PstA [Alkalimonas sp.]|nr:phosphate ABC transporter permease PstA [Alkalimonas sp.]